MIKSKLYLTKIGMVAFLFVLILGCTSNKAPVVDAGDNLYVSVGETFNFAGSAEDDGKIISYEWDADGDGSYDTFCNGCGKDPYSFEKPGTYTARLKVTDDEGNVGMDEITIVVLEK